VKDPADELAWREFVEFYSPLIFRWAKRSGLQDADAEEATSRVLLRLYRYLPNFDYDPSRGRFRAYISRTLKSAISEMFREWRHIARTTEDTHGQLLLRLQQYPDAATDLLAELEEEQEFHRWRAAKRLAQKRCDKEHVWQAWSLTKEHQKSPKEAAEQLGIKLATLYMYVSRVNTYVREEFEKLDK
jgi:RNA polymerase sigma-70 factor (ECF subfamily)